MDPFIKEQINLQKIKYCPGCGIFVEKIDGCNYLKCFCNTEFCWICNKIKYKENGCNEKEHNSH